MMSDAANWVNCIAERARKDSDAIALVKGQERLSYQDLWQRSGQFAAFLTRSGLAKGDRVAFYLPKSIEAVVALVGVARAGGVMVPVNPVLKADQFSHIIKDAGADILVTLRARLKPLRTQVEVCKQVICVDDMALDKALTFESPVDVSAEDLCILFYTSGSTGRPKGVMVTHGNMKAGAEIVASYLGIRKEDNILSLLPWSFDYGFNQLAGGLQAGASVVLMDFLLPQDVPRQVERHDITVLGCVPPLWHQLMGVDWSDQARDGMRIVTNTGGRVSISLSARLKAQFPNAKLFLMYGLTEAFRSTYLDPEQVEERPESIGKAVPGEEVLIVNDQGEKCQPGEIGELVHSGRLVSAGYWQDDVKTARRFKAPPKASRYFGTSQLSVYSGDKARYDEEGFIYFIGRDDEMIKTSGYRVSPTEIEELAMSCAGVGQAFACGVDDEYLGQSIALVLESKNGASGGKDSFLSEFKAKAPSFMVPKSVIWMENLPIGPHGKLDRVALAAIVAKGE